MSRGPARTATASRRPRSRTRRSRFDENGFGRGADNAAAVGSLTIYRAFRYGRNAELILTDNRSYKIADADVSAVSPDGFPMFADEDTARVIDDGRTANGGKPPATLQFAGQDVPNAGVDQPMQTYTSGRSSARGSSTA